MLLSQQPFSCFVLRCVLDHRVECASIIKYAARFAVSWTARAHNLGIDIPQIPCFEQLVRVVIKLLTSRNCATIRLLLHAASYRLFSNVLQQL